MAHQSRHAPGVEYRCLCVRLLSNAARKLPVNKFLQDVNDAVERLISHNLLKGPRGHIVKAGTVLFQEFVPGYRIPDFRVIVYA